MTKEKMLRRGRQTKIVATLGPASSDAAVLRELFLAGVDTFRLNFSHGSHEDHAARYHAVREIEKEFGRPIGIFADLQGPKLRLGVFENGMIDVTEGHVITLDSDPTPGNETRVHMPHPEILKSLNIGDPLLIDDGKVNLTIIEKQEGQVTARVNSGNKLMDRKGVNLPGTLLQMSALTEKDRIDLDFALELGVDWIALSFVQRPEDVIEAREIIGDRAGIIVKVEKPSAVEFIDEIVALTDAIMLARGDLGVECPPESVPVIQKHIVRSARSCGIPLIIATQMMESMTTHATPTRAEASDVATAVYDGADAVMLSAETASGQYPVQTVKMMDRILTRVEQDDLYRTVMDSVHPVPEQTFSNALTAAAHDVVETVGAQLIVNFSASGNTVLRMVRERPYVPILALTIDQAVARRLSLSYGANPTITQTISNFEDMIEAARQTALQHEFVEPGDIIVITSGDLRVREGTTNTLRVIQA